MFAGIVMEEVLFRLPLAFAVRYLRFVGVLLSVLVLSIAFAWVHGNLSTGRLLLQGMGGIVLSVIFLKCGGLNGKVLKPLAVCVGYHITWDVLTFGFVSLDI
jgi:hypothetical protein